MASSGDEPSDSRVLDAQQVRQKIELSTGILAGGADGMAHNQTRQARNPSRFKDRQNPASIGQLGSMNPIRRRDESLVADIDSVLIVV